MEKIFIGVLIDRSGSMNSIKEEAEGGLRSFFEEQRKNTTAEQQVLTTLSQFDNVYETVWENKDIKENTEYHLEPRGMTALLDAVGRMVSEVSSTLNNLDEQPAKKILVVLTDGKENSSKEWTYPQIKELLESKQKEGWEVLFLGANIDAAKEGQKMGLRADRTMTYAATGEGIGSAFASVSRSVLHARNNEEYNLSEE